MAAVLNTTQGPKLWGLDVDDDGYREYKVTWLVTTTNVQDGPRQVFDCPGMPITGAVYAFGTDFDPWCYCRPNMKVTAYDQKENTKFWNVEQTYSNKPGKRCQDTPIEDPLLEPMRIGGSFVKKTKEITRDRNGKLIKNSAHEQMHGPKVEFDFNHPTVKIGQNVLHLELDVFAAMVDHVNDGPMWGVPKRCVKLSNVSWERKIKGACEYYYTRDFEFDINVEKNDNGSLRSGHDRYLLDEGTKVLNGHWLTYADQPGDEGEITGNMWVLDYVRQWVTTSSMNLVAPDKNNPQHFIRYKDRHHENARVILDGNGRPALVASMDADWTEGMTAGQPGRITVEYYPEVNFFLLGIPISL